MASRFIRHRPPIALHLSSSMSISKLVSTSLLLPRVGWACTSSASTRRACSTLADRCSSLERIQSRERTGNSGRDQRRTGIHVEGRLLASTRIRPAIISGERPRSSQGVRLAAVTDIRHFSSVDVKRNSVERIQNGSDSYDAGLPSPAPPPMNQVQVPMISNYLQSQIFPPVQSPFAPPPPSAQAISISQAHLKTHGLLSPAKTAPKKLNAPTKVPAPAIDFVLPELQGPTIAHHFQSLAHHTAEPYLSLARSFASYELPPMPDPQTWILNPGWTHYSLDGSWQSVEYPDEGDSVMVFDVETLPYCGGDYPVMAVAAGRGGWYGWASPWLTGNSEVPNHLIPFGSSSTSTLSSSTPNSTSSLPFPADSTLFERPSESPRLLIGHNVLFDRARTGSEYTLRRPATRWLDTQSLHIATAGITNPQRPAWMIHRRQEREKAAAAKEKESETGVESQENIQDVVDKIISKMKVPTVVAKDGLAPPPKAKRWQEVSSMNSLVEVAKLHCGIEIDKSLRNVFIDPATTIQDLRENFESLIGYCALDVLTTHAVYQVVLPKFLERCPHPASFSGILLMSQPVLPVDYQWPRYLERAEKEYEERLVSVKASLHALAEEARKLMGKVGKDGKWLWESDPWLSQLDWSPKRARRLPRVAGGKDIVSAVVSKPIPAPKTTTSIPTWYASVLSSSSSPSKASLQLPLVATLFQTTWRSFPTFFSQSRGWLFAVPTHKKFVAAPREELVTLKSLPVADERLKSLRGMKLYTIPSRGSGRCLKLLSDRHLDEGLIASVYPEMALSINLKGETTGATYDKVMKKLKALAEEAVAGGASRTGANNLWLRQLDWTPVDLIETSSSLPARTKAIAPEDVKEDDLVWPQWYLDLDKPGIGLDISIGKRAAPLLLKLQWKGHPISHSKQHGWTFRVPLKEVKQLLALDPSLKPVEFEEVADATLLDDAGAVYIRLPHAEGDKNVGNPLSKSFVSAFDTGVLSSEYPAAAAALALNASCSYWASAKVRILNQMVVWEGDAKVPAPATIAPTDSTAASTQGLILPQVIPMGTVTRRAVERTWLTASNAKKNRVGSELKSMIRAPPGYAIVGADVDSEELWICSVMGDAQFGIHGATAIGWMTLEGTKSAGTDLHSKSASILGISRDDAKVFNYSRIYGAGVKHAVQLLVKSNPKLTKDEATKLAQNLYASTKGVTSRSAFNRDFWHGGTESFVFNKLEQIAQSDHPLTPALGCGITDALTKAFLPTSGRDTYLPSRINWVVQSSGVDYLHLLLVSMEYLTRRFNIDARYMISVHDEVRYLVKEEDRYRAAMAMQISNLWTRGLFSYRLQMGDLPQSCAFFSAVDLDHCFRKEVNMACITPSNPDPIRFGESFDISASLATTSNGSLFADGRSMKFEADLLPIASAAEYYPDPLNTKEEQHRVVGTPFLIAQTETDPAAIRRLWNEARGMKPTTAASKRSTSVRNRVELSSPGLSREEVMGSIDLPLTRKPNWTTKGASKSRVVKSTLYRSPLSRITPRVDAELEAMLAKRRKEEVEATRLATLLETEFDNHETEGIPAELMDEYYSEEAKPDRVSV